MGYILSIDQGTTSTRAILFDKHVQPVAMVQKALTQHYPASGWVEHDPEEIWDAVVETVRAVLKKAQIDAKDVAGIGLTNQRETTVIWDRGTGALIHRAIVWQDRRTADLCTHLKSEGHEPMIVEKTGLLLDPYFSGTKVKWILDHVDGVQARAKAGQLAFGTIDSYLIWRLTGGQSHVTDATNAARTLLFNIHTQTWDPDICALLGIPQTLLPEVCDCAAAFGVTPPDLFGAAIPILGVAGDQQAATIGQACFETGMLKATYGTGCFALLNTGAQPLRSNNRLLTTVAYRLNGKVTYALEGAIFIAGAVVQWMRDGLAIIAEASEAETLAQAANPDQRVYLVPAFVGLGAPYWDAGARGAIYGLTRDTGPKELARAALESVGYQTRDLLEAMQADGAALNKVIRVDGGMSASDWTMQFLADMVEATVDRPVDQEATARGAAWLAGHQAGLYPSATEFAKTWALEQRFEPKMNASKRHVLYDGWCDAVRRTRTDAPV